MRDEVEAICVMYVRALLCCTNMRPYHLLWSGLVGKGRNKHLQRQGPDIDVIGPNGADGGGLFQA